MGRMHMNHYEPISVEFFFFFNDTATTEIYTLSLHDALPIWRRPRRDSLKLREGWSYTRTQPFENLPGCSKGRRAGFTVVPYRSEEHTSELQSRQYLVCRLLLEKKKIYLLDPSHCMLLLCFTT